ncbi:hypothetical protein Q6350_03055 [Isoptericola sp. b515]|uniref:hypothetical protein n=1 Tax=Isoptericola sp. b515 TaxID=3064652 RepID=UPI002712613F|nr:hypothetical protein [Isoptericola sp. b515]MDO8147402.1 hypothetical protein [Isoptericola sp. b515]
MSRDPRDTLRIVGGATLDRVDADAVRDAAGHLDAAAASLRSAAWDCSEAGRALERAVWTPAPWGEADPARPTRLRRAGTLVGDTAGALGARAAVCTTLADRLRRAAGLYTHAESLAEQAVGAGVTVVAGAVGLGVTGFLRSPAGLPALLTGAAGLVGLSAAAPDPDMPPPAPPPPPSPSPDEDGDRGGWLLRTAAPFVDEALAGAGVGVALAAPDLAAGDLSVTGGARVLSAAVSAVLGSRPVHVDLVEPGAFDTGPPAGDDRPLAGVEEALARTADLYPHGSGLPGRPTPGAPPGTVAVQEVVSADGSSSWTVLIPGTQALLSPANPFDVDTDLDLMAHRSADVAEGVVQALADAGARPDEPVVLVGHSLGGIAAVALASSPAFRRRHRVGGVVTAGAPTATFRTPPGVPVLHLETTEELVSPLDGRSSTENPATADRVTVGRDLADSRDPADRSASGGVATAHSVATHLRTLEHARALDSVQVAGVVGRIDRLLDGDRAETRYYRVRRG